MRDTQIKVNPTKEEIVVDLMAAYVIPLFYAFLNYPELLQEFLNQYNNNSLYVTTCDDLHKALIGTREIREDKLANLQKQLDETQNEITTQTELLNLFLQLEKNLNQKKHGQDPVDCKVQNSASNQIELATDLISTLQKKASVLEVEIKDLEAAMTEEEEFLWEIKSYYQNPYDGPEYLKNYFARNLEIADIILKHKEIFEETAKGWIDYVMPQNFTLNKHPLPPYFCPFNAKEKDRTTTAHYKILEKKNKSSAPIETKWQRSTHPFVARYVIVLKKKMTALAMQMRYIQKTFFYSDPTDLLKGPYFEPIPEENDFKKPALKENCNRSQPENNNKKETTDGPEEVPTFEKLALKTKLFEPIDENNNNNQTIDTKEPPLERKRSLSL